MFLVYYQYYKIQTIIIHVHVENIDPLFLVLNTCYCVFKNHMG